MTRNGPNRFIIKATLTALVFSLFLSLFFARSTRKQQLALQLEAFNSQLSTFDSGLSQLAAFLTEPGDLNDDNHLTRRLNRFVYGNRGVVGIELLTRKGSFRNSNSPSGEYINGGVSLPDCGPESNDLTLPAPRVLRACANNDLAIERRFDSFDGSPVLLRLIISPEALPGGTDIAILPVQASANLRCASQTFFQPSPCLARQEGASLFSLFEAAFPYFLISLFFSLASAFLFFQWVLVPLRTLNKMLLQPSSTAGNTTSNTLSRLGILRLFREPVGAITELLRKKSDLERQKAESQARERVADEVVHNIQSPLATLQGIEPELVSVNEEARIAFRSALTRIGDIVNLLQKPTHQTLGRDRSETHLAASLIEVLLSEKRKQYMHRRSLSFRFENDSATYGIFVEADSTLFKTVLSNLIKNAVEAIPENRAGRITIQLRPLDESCFQIVVADNGVGMSLEVLENATKPGFSHEKPLGKGLGLPHAANSVESWGGTFELESTLGLGTRAHIILPRGSAPIWFLPCLQIDKGASVAILDDDPSIHHLWKTRLSGACLLQHFHHGSELEKAIKTGGTFDLLLIDYELLGESETGLDVVSRLGLTTRTILVTSRFEDAGVRERCETLGIRLLPKGLAGQVPVHCREASESKAQSLADAVFLDDDALLRQTWERAAKRAGLRLKTFSDPDEFLCATSNFSTTTPIYVDLRLGKDIDGVKVCQHLQALGFNRIHLSTGARNHNAPPWLNVVGKTPPFRSQKSNEFRQTGITPHG